MLYIIQNTIKTILDSHDIYNYMVLSRAVQYPQALPVLQCYMYVQKCLSV